MGDRKDSWQTRAPRLPYLALLDFEDEEGEIVLLLGLGGPIFDGPQYAALDPGGRQSGVFQQEFDQAVFAELFAEGASRFDHSVGEGDERVAAPQFYLLPLRIPCHRKGPARSRRRRRPDAPPLPGAVAEQQRRIVAGVRISERRTPLVELGVEEGNKARVHHRAGDLLVDALDDAPRRTVATYKGVDAPFCMSRRAWASGADWPADWPSSEPPRPPAANVRDHDLDPPRRDVEQVVIIAAHRARGDADPFAMSSLSEFGIERGKRRDWTAAAIFIFLIEPLLFGRDPQQFADGARHAVERLGQPGELIAPGDRDLVVKVAGLDLHRPLVKMVNRAGDRAREDDGVDDGGQRDEQKEDDQERQSEHDRAADGAARFELLNALIDARGLDEGRIDSERLVLPALWFATL